MENNLEDAMKYYRLGIQKCNLGDDRWTLTDRNFVISPSVFITNFYSHSDESNFELSNIRVAIIDDDREIDIDLNNPDY